MGHRRHYVQLGKELERWTYRFFTRGGIFEDLLVNLGLHFHLRISFTDGWVLQLRNVCVNEEVGLRLSGAPDPSGPSTESRSY